MRDDRAETRVIFNVPHPELGSGSDGVPAVKVTESVAPCPQYWIARDSG
jgi:hypothetical protein